MSAAVTGAERIAEAFESARADGRRAALMPYLMAGYPDLESSRAIARAYVDGGADLIELGIPFSDPLADGPVIHAADVAALAAGAKRRRRAGGRPRRSPTRSRWSSCVTSNLILARGLERFADMLVAVGASGLIVPDLPLEEAPAALAACDERGPGAGAARRADDARRAPGADRRARPRLSLHGLGDRHHRGAGRQRRAACPMCSRAPRPTPTCRSPSASGSARPSRRAPRPTAGADGVIIGSRLVRAAGEAADPVGRGARARQGIRRGASDRIPRRWHS